MRPVEPSEAARIEDLEDAALVERASQRDGAAFWLIIKRHNQSLYRVIRGVLGDETEAEDVIQETYLHAFKHLSDFRGDAKLSTWLIRIALNQALGRLRQQHPLARMETIEAIPMTDASASALFRAADPDPEAATEIARARRLLEQAVSSLPEPFRVVFVLRDVEEMSTEETAVLLGLRPQTVKTRLHRARRLLRRALQDKLITAFSDTFLFTGERCDRLTQSILDRFEIALLSRLSLA